MRPPFLEEYDFTDDYRTIVAIFEGDTDNEVAYRHMLSWDLENGKLLADWWERAWTRDDCFEEVKHVPPEVARAWSGLQQRAETWARTGTDPGARLRGNSLSRGSWRQA